MKLKKLVRKLLWAGALLLTLLPFSAYAEYSVEKLPDETVYNDFVVGPGKIELNLSPGETRTINLIVSNRLGSPKTFQIQTEDFTGSRDPQQTVVLLSDAHGPYSLQDYLNVSSETFTINHAERVTIPVTVSVPTDAEAGGLYGSVVVSTVTTQKDSDSKNVSGSVTSPIVTRIGTLFFVRVSGEVKEEGELTDFSIKNRGIILSPKTIDFRLLYENNGTVHVNPYGVIRVENILGATIATLPIEPWFALPNSLRLREVSWTSSFLFGRYKATAEINRGYGDIIDTKQLVFWVIPWKIVLAVFAGLFIIIAGIRFIFSRFTIARR